MSNPHPDYSVNGTNPGRRETSDNRAATMQIDQLIKRIETQAIELERGTAARLQLVARVNDLNDEVQVERAACDHKEKDRHALALEVDRLNALVVDLTRQVELGRLSVDSFVELDKLRIKEISQLRATIAEQTKEIERLKRPTVYGYAADDDSGMPSIMPDGPVARYPMASSFPPPVPLASYRVTVATRMGEIKAFYGDDDKWHRSDNGDVIYNVVSWE
jgi:hypothetical protein